MTDPRIAPVEDNLDAFVDSITGSGEFETGPDTDVATFWSDIPFPMLNGICSARFAPGTVETRAREVVAPYLERGLPCMWWATPSGHAVELEPVLRELGFAGWGVPGMYRPIDGPVDPRVPPGTSIERTGLTEHVPTMLTGFGIPEELEEHLLRFFSGLDPAHVVHLVASLDGRPVATGMMWLAGPTAGLYNITTLEDARGLGIGYAVTASLLNAGREAGATQAILHATALGLPVYERLGFQTVCEVPQFVWSPAPAA